MVGFYQKFRLALAVTQEVSINGQCGLSFQVRFNRFSLLGRPLVGSPATYPQSDWKNHRFYHA